MLERKKQNKIQLELHFNPKHYASFGCSERDVELYKEVFDLFDSNDVGYLTPKDIRRAMELFGYNPKPKIVYEILSNINSEESGEILFKDFLKVMIDEKRPCDLDTKEDYENTFEYYDFDSKGYINREDIRNVAMDLNENLDD